MNANNAIWEKGDFLKIIDLGCGDGTTALSAARPGANVPDVDIKPNQVDAGNKRVQDENIANRLFQQGGASDLSKHADDVLHSVLSIYGAAMTW